MVNCIIPTYKAKETLPRALESLVNQTYKNFFVTVVQDCDGEDYTDIITEFEPKLSIRLVQTEINGGPGMARQFGIDLSKMFEYIMFLDSDDILMPRAIEALYYAAKDKNADVVVSDFAIRDEAHRCDIAPAKSTPVTWTHGKMYRRQFLVDNNIRFLPELRMNEDSYFNLVVFNTTSNQIRVPEVTYMWMQHEGSITNNKNDEFFKKSWVQYLYSQAAGIVKITEVAESASITVIARTIINIYKHYMKAAARGYDTDQVYPMLHDFFNKKIIKVATNEGDFWKIIAKDLPACDFDEDTLFFFDIPFNKWLVSFQDKEEQTNA